MKQALKLTLSLIKVINRYNYQTNQTSLDIIIRPHPTNQTSLDIIIRLHPTNQTSLDIIIRLHPTNQTSLDIIIRLHPTNQTSLDIIIRLHPTNQMSTYIPIEREIQSTNQSNVIMYMYHTKGNHRDSIDQPIKRHYVHLSHQR
jgi:citrate lyase gamma subunit